MMHQIRLILRHQLVEHTPTIALTTTDSPRNIKISAAFTAADAQSTNAQRYRDNIAATLSSIYDASSPPNIAPSIAPTNSRNLSPIIASSYA